MSRTAGVAGGALALLAYNSIQICLYGLLGFSLTTFLPNIGLAWWGWAIIAWIVIGVFGLLHIQLNAKVLAVTLGLEILVIVLFDLAALNHPLNGHVQFTGLAPHSLFTAGIGGVFAFGIAAFVGYESGLAYGEEASGTRPVSRATFTALFFLAALYTVSSLSLSVTEGPSGVVDAARDPNSGIPFSIISNIYGSPLAWLANLLLITSILGAMLSFHNTAARYTYALARENVLPRAFASTGKSGRTASSPIGGSILQSVLALIVFGVFAVAGADPLATLVHLAQCRRRPGHPAADDQHVTRGRRLFPAQSGRRPVRDAVATRRRTVAGRGHTEHRPGDHRGQHQFRAQQFLERAHRRHTRHRCADGDRWPAVGSHAAHEKPRRLPVHRLGSTTTAARTDAGLPGHPTVARSARGRSPQSRLSLLVDREADTAGATDRSPSDGDRFGVARTSVQ